MRALPFNDRRRIGARHRKSRFVYPHRLPKALGYSPFSEERTAAMQALFFAFSMWEADARRALGEVRP